MPRSYEARFPTKCWKFCCCQFEVRNEVTSFLDLGTVYGRNESISSILREGEGGMPKINTYYG